MAGPLLNPSLLRQLEQLQLLATRRAKSSSRGERRSRARGQSVEFADYRNYVPGDDFRYLDWNLFGRFERLFLKLYEEERELPVRIYLDCSESMSFGTPSKFQFALQLAAAIGYVALCGFDRVSVRPFPSLHESMPEGELARRAALQSVRGKKSAMQFLGNLSALSTGGAASVNQSLRRAAAESRSTGLAVVISDFLDPEGYEQGLSALLGRGHEVDVLQVLAPEEISPAAYGDLRLVDSETGQMQEVTFGKYRLKAYQKTLNGFLGRFKEFCTARGICYMQTRSDADLRELLLKRMRNAEVWS